MKYLHTEISKICLFELRQLHDQHHMVTRVSLRERLREEEEVTNKSSVLP